MLRTGIDTLAANLPIFFFNTPSISFNRALLSALLRSRLNVNERFSTYIRLIVCNCVLVLLNALECEVFNGVKRQFKLIKWVIYRHIVGHYLFTKSVFRK